MSCSPDRHFRMHALFQENHMKCNWLAACVMVGLGIVSLAAEKPKSEDALSAQKRYEKDKQNLDAAYAKELASIHKSYVAALTAARKAAIEANNFDEVTAITEVIKQIEAKPQGAKEEATTVDVSTGKAVIVSKGLSVKDLEGRKFRYDVAPEGRLLVLGKGGKIGEYKGPNEVYWRLTKDGKLGFHPETGGPNVIFDKVYTLGKTLYLEGHCYPIGKPVFLRETN